MNSTLINFNWTQIPLDVQFFNTMCIFWMLDINQKKIINVQISPLTLCNHEIFYTIQDLRIWNNTKLIQGNICLLRKFEFGWLKKHETWHLNMKTCSTRIVHHDCNYNESPTTMLCYAIYMRFINRYRHFW